MKILFLLVVLFLSANSAIGCSYLGYPDPPLSYIISKFETIFVGTLIAKKTTIEKDEGGIRFRVKRMKIKVEQTLKGVNQEFQDIATREALVRDSCFVEPTEFKVGEKWIIHRDFDWGTGKRRNTYGMFFSSSRLLKSQDNREYLAKIEQYIKNPVMAIYGQMETRWGGQIFKEVEVYLEGNGFKTSTKTDNFGRYSFENIPAGDYRIQIRFPTRTVDIYNNQEAVFNAETKTFNIEYMASIKAGGSDYYYIVHLG